MSEKESSVQRSVHYSTEVTKATTPSDPSVGPGSVLAKPTSLCFPTVNSAQRVASGVQSRTKVPLKAGRSLMDWMQLCRSRKDLSGRGGRLCPISTAELARHNQSHDCWISVHGLVYNITPYLEYHPGGHCVLKDASGQDGTALFNEVHCWVNCESMLRACLVGYLCKPTVTRPASFVGPKSACKAKSTTPLQLVLRDKPPMGPQSFSSAEPSNDLQFSSSADPSADRQSSSSAELSTGPQSSSSAELSTGPQTSSSAEPSTGPQSSSSTELSMGLQTSLSAEPSTGPQTSSSAELSMGLQSSLIAEPSTGPQSSLSAEPFTSPQLYPSSPALEENLTGVQHAGTPPGLCKIQHPRYEWFQATDIVVVSIYTKLKVLKKDLVIVHLENNVVYIDVRLPDFSYLLHMELEEKVKEAFTVRVAEAVGRVEVKLLKVVPGVMWKSLGRPRAEHNTEAMERTPVFQTWRVKSHRSLTHDVFLLSILPPPGCHLLVPPGCHVFLRVRMDGVLITKAYTPVPERLLSIQDEGAATSMLHFAIKVYPDGSFSPILHKLLPGNDLCVGGFAGPFRTSSLTNVTKLLLVAAGTGITPMGALLSSIRASSSLQKLCLLFFNKKKCDIIWKEELDELVTADNRVDVHHILSQEEGEWSGRRGKVNKQLLGEFLPRLEVDHIPDGAERMPPACRLACVCGPDMFTECSMNFLTELGCSSEEICAFRG
uniref:cytochrome b5 reductase 4 n=1 Tax=Myxine glutinosa TaxID=7769 RepID=UPI00358F3C3C